MRSELLWWLQQAALSPAAVRMAASGLRNILKQVIAAFTTRNVGASLECLSLEVVLCLLFIAALFGQISSAGLPPKSRRSFTPAQLQMGIAISTTHTHLVLYRSRRPGLVCAWPVCKFVVQLSTRLVAVVDSSSQCQSQFQLASSPEAHATRVSIDPMPCVPWRDSCSEESGHVSVRKT